VRDREQAQREAAGPIVAIRLEEALPAAYDRRVAAAVRPRNGGRACALPRQRMPRHAPAVATFRS
jgi:hypothetical protein